MLAQNWLMVEYLRMVRDLLRDAPGAGGTIGGLFNGERMWAAVVNRGGQICSYATSTDDPTQVWPGSQAIAKAKAAAEVHSHRPVLAADTTVVVDEHILAKPEDIQDARRMLRLLQGRWHQVLTGIALVYESGIVVDVETTDVRFAPMNQAEIDWYVSTGEPMDKAGAYAIQGQGSRFIEGIKGDYFNVMGLPVRLVYELIVHR